MYKKISLEALGHNVAQLQQYAQGKTLIAVVKANAYGLGLDVIAPHLNTCGISHFAVASVDEGVALRSCQDAHILIMGGIFVDEIGTIVDHNLVPTISDLSLLQTLIEFAQRKRRELAIQFKVDTGMGRCGFWPDQLSAYLDALELSDKVKLEGAYSHFASAADNPGLSEQQQRCFDQV